MEEIKIAKKGYGSVYGEAKRLTYEYVNSLPKNSKVLIVDCFDRQYTFPYLRKGFNVTCYETDELLLNGGNTDEYKVIGFKNRVSVLGFGKQIKIIEKNFYEEKVTEKYDFIFVHDSLHLKRNKEISMKNKIDNKFFNRKGICLYLLLSTT